jgi:DNA-binding NtrC family response regulator
MTTAPFDDGAIAGKRVLLAEDDVSARTVIAKVLRAMGLEVIEIHDGGRLLVAVTSYYKDGRSPDDLDLVITDVRMPVMSGLEIFKGLRVAHWKLPVIVMTAFETAEVTDAIARYGAVLLIKPLDLEALESLVRRMLTEAR